MTESDSPVVVEFDVERAERHYTKLRRAIAAWFRRRGGKVGGTVGEIVLLLPDLFALVIRLMGDRRLPAWTKVQLAAVTAYVISPIDFVPDFLFPIGLVDDTVALAFVLSRIVVLMEGAGAEILAEHWEGPGSVLAALLKVAGAADSVLSGKVVERLRASFGGDGAAQPPANPGQAPAEAD
jgi:uncharacterized membrane protein YkvA (DUF1232 family)